MQNTKFQYIIIRTLTVASPIILKIIIGVMPILIGTVMLAMVFFYDYVDTFSTFSKGAYTLFALQAGDMLYDFYTRTTECSPLIGTAFCYIYVFFCVSILQNIFMVVVEDSYISIKYQKNFDWLQNNG
jgi:hypothetical protein